MRGLRDFMIKIQPANSPQYDALIKIWESSVRATHNFLPESDIERLKPLIKEQYMPNVTLFVALDHQNIPRGFIGTDENRIEMLFIDSNKRGQGIGKLLLEYVLNEIQVDEVDVNEQNPQAIGFYQYMGFVVVKRVETDGEGKPYPILTMKYQK